MSIKIEHLEEPKLQFARDFEHEDSKTGLAEFGPFGQNVSGLHPSEIRLGFIGTRETISGAKEWIEECSHPIESQNIKVVNRRSHLEASSLFPEEFSQNTQRTRLEKILNRDFVGFNRESPFNCCFQTNERWEKSIPHRELQAILSIEDKAQRIGELVSLFESYISSLATTDPSPNIIILALTPEIADEAHSVRLSGNFYLNFRRMIKARAMKWGIPIQLLRRRTITGKGKDIQEKATRAWNFCTAQYYKAGGIPWRPTTLERDVCFVGISFYVAQELSENLTMRASVAQAFDYLGQGLVLRGDPFIWNQDKQGKTPHLTQQGAYQLIRETLHEYMKVTGMPPRRVVIHKSSEFWGREHQEYNELDGFYEGIEAVFPKCESDLVTLKQTGIDLFREGVYPPLRGTYFCIEEAQHFLYTMGFMPYLDTYPGSYVPEPWQITEHHGGSAPKELLREILALTKMNVNNCSFADGTPITISFSGSVGEIMKHIPDDGIVQPKYKFYM
ncbi:argonaute/piwi family protein [Coleofasciculus sp.]|uniref:argonaute/piwi family protein n=1 Tax=Coleofasciculus sp. TaxID=3100458 RepID=UPI0039F9C728